MDVAWCGEQGVPKIKLTSKLFTGRNFATLDSTQEKRKNDLVSEDTMELNGELG